MAIEYVIDYWDVTDQVQKTRPATAAEIEEINARRTGGDEQPAVAQRIANRALVAAGLLRLLQPEFSALPDVTRVIAESAWDAGAAGAILQFAQSMGEAAGMTSSEIEVVLAGAVAV